MQAKTKFQKLVVGLSQKLPPITEKQKDWALLHCLSHKATLLKDGTLSCLDCGHRWKSDHKLLDIISGCLCPECGMKLSVKRTRLRKFYEWDYFGIITSIRGLQVIRLIKITGNYKVGQKAYLSIWELSQIFISPDGRYEFIGYNHLKSWYMDTWTGSFTLRTRKSVHNHDIMPGGIYPARRCIQEIRRNGFKGGFHGITPFTFFRLILTNPKAETLLKSGQYSLLKNFNRIEINDYWSSVKICIRNNYVVKDAEMWMDYLRMLRYFGRDLNSPKYVCPPDLRLAHDRLVRKRNERELKLDIEKRKKHIQKENISYIQMRQPYFDLIFKKGNLTIDVLKSVEDVLGEGLTHKHCVYASNYHKKKDSLLLSAKINGLSIETVEVSLSRMQVVQSRGFYNKHSEHHDQIVQLVNKNMQQIKKRFQNGTQKEKPRAEAASAAVV